MVKVRELDKLAEETKLCPGCHQAYLVLYRNYSEPWQALWKCQSCGYEQKVKVEDF